MPLRNGIGMNDPAVPKSGHIGKSDPISRQIVRRCCLTPYEAKDRPIALHHHRKTERLGASNRIRRINPPGGGKRKIAPRRIYLRHDAVRSRMRRIGREKQTVGRSCRRRLRQALCAISRKRRFRSRLSRRPAGRAPMNLPKNAICETPFFRYICQIPPAGDPHADNGRTLKKSPNIGLLRRTVSDFGYCIIQRIER